MIRKDEEGNTEKYHINLHPRKFIWSCLWSCTVCHLFFSLGRTVRWSILRSLHLFICLHRFCSRLWISLNSFRSIFSCCLLLVLFESIFRIQILSLKRILPHKHCHYAMCRYLSHQVSQTCTRPHTYLHSQRIISHNHVLRNLKIHQYMCYFYA